jgi:hypothetical protein
MLEHRMENFALSENLGESLSTAASRAQVAMMINTMIFSMLERFSLSLKTFFC